MSDTPELEPGQNLPAPRPPAEPAPVERFSASPSVLANELSPERAARIVRQSSNARWVGFLTVIVVILFTAIYWFYEVGGPLGISEPRLDAELTAQQVTAVERGYNVFEANCARCHGVNGEGGIGPTLNRQDKLFAHLNENYLRTVLATGGRYVCGDANSLMPVWSNLSTPPGPLNYRADRRADRVPAGHERRHLHRPRRRARHAPEGPADRQGQDLHRLARPEVPAGPGRDPVSGLLEDRVRGAVRRRPAPRARPARARAAARRVAVGRPRPRARVAAAGAPRSRSWPRASRSRRPA